MVKIVLRAREIDRTFEFKKLDKGSLAMLQLMVLLAAMGGDAVIAIMDEANWQKMKGEQQK